MSAKIRDRVLRVYRSLIESGYHRPNEELLELEAILGDLGMTEGQIDNVYNEGREP